MQHDDVAAMELAEQEEYSLSAELEGHEADVRSVCTLPDGSIVTSSRDKSIRIWAQNAEGTWETKHILHGHEHFVSVVIPLPSGSSQISKGGLASGGNDSIINIWDLSQPSDPVMTLTGHEKPVVALSTTVDGNLISGSWDHTARVWQGSQCIAELKGHTQAVWAVLGLPNGAILTGAADKEIKLWEGGVCTRTYTGHTDCVRALVNVEGIGFLSAANDGVLKLWTYGGECLSDFHGHSSFIFSATNIPGGYASVGEDRTLKIWRDGACVQTLLHPATVWAVAALSNGDIVTAGSDGVARVWSRHPKRIASAEARQIYDAKVAAVAIPSSAVEGGGGGGGGSIGSLNTENLPGPEALQVPGTHADQKLILKNQGRVEVYLWDTTAGIWSKIGEVVDAVPSGSRAKSMVDGKEYDYVFDVDLGDGAMRKLGYNVTENPYTAAQQFLWREELPQGYLDEVANFIIRNTRGFTLGVGDTAFADPFTGGNRYIPGAGQQPQGAGGADPFTGGSRYVPSYFQPPLPTSTPTPTLTPTSTPAYTITPISGRPTSTPTPTSTVTSTPSPMSTSSTTTTAKFKHFPNQGMLYFETTNLEAVAKKIREFNAQLKSSEEEKQFALEAAEEGAGLNGVIAILKDTSRYHASTFSEAHLKLIRKLLAWPDKYLFPGLDLVRSVMLHPDGARYFGEAFEAGKLDVVNLLLNNISTSLSAPNQIMALRALTNMFHWKATREVVVGRGEAVLEAAADAARSPNKSVRLALSTLIVNFAVHFLTNKNADAKIQCLSVISELLGVEGEEEEAVYRDLVGLGTLAWQDDPIKALAADLDLASPLSRVASSASAAPKVKEAANDLLEYLNLKS